MASQNERPPTTTRKPRVEDVAREAGVSTATVSRSFNDPGKVIPEVRDRVMEAARKVGWLPHAAGSALARRRSLLIGTVIPTLRSGIFANFVAGLQARLRQEGTTLLVSVSGNDPEIAMREARVMLSRGAEALSLVGQSYPSELFELLSARSVAYVITHEFRENSAHSCIGLDNHAAFASVTKHLLSLGHRRFGLIMPDPRHNSRVADRILGVRDTLTGTGLEMDPRHVITGEWSPRMGYEAALTMLADSRPTAIICGNDQIAIGVLAAARELGLKVPDDLSVTGFDDDPVSALVFPSLTTAKTDSALMGKMAAEVLLEQLAGGRSISHQMDLTFIERDTTGPADNTMLRLESDL